MENIMLTRILAASTLVFGLAASGAMAQSVGDRSEINGVPTSSMDDTMIDTGTTGSIYPDGTMGTTVGSDKVSTGALGPCASAPGTMGPDANASMNINDKYCGK